MAPAGIPALAATRGIQDIQAIVDTLLTLVIPVSQGTVVTLDIPGIVVTPETLDTAE